MRARLLIPILFSVFILSACGTLTGIPSHGGGKRFAVEQELVAASARAAVKDMDLQALHGRKVALYIATMGDQGSGSLTRGRYSIDALIRGEYINSPAVRTDYTYPRYETTAETTSGGLTGLTTSLSTLNAPALSRTQSDGSGSRSSLGLNIGGMGDYRNETLTTNPRDTAFLSHLVQTVFFLRGIDVVSPANADTDMFINIDVFGTIRNRTEMHLYNAETLKAQTKLEYFAVDRNNKKLLIKPKTNAFEAAYKENYALWMGPYKVSKGIKPTEGLMVDFSDIRPYGNHTGNSAPSVEADNSHEGYGYSDEAVRQHRQGQP